MSADGGQRISWFWPAADPDQWQLQVSSDGVTGWVNGDQTPGGDRAVEGADCGIFYRIYGATFGNVPTTGTSNVIFNPC